jgi:hypothetical protein
MRTATVSAVLSTLYFLLSTGSAYAYLDPGTGSMLLQGLVAGVAAGATAITVFYDRIRNKIQRLFGKTNEQQD